MRRQIGRRGFDDLGNSASFAASASSRGFSRRLKSAFASSLSSPPASVQVVITEQTRAWAYWM